MVMSRSVCLAFVLLLSGCDEVASGSDPLETGHTDPFPSTYMPPEGPDLFIKGAKIFDGAGNLYEKASILVRDGRIEALGTDLETPEDVELVDAAGKYVTPGIIDPHTHLGNAGPPFYEEKIDVWDVNETSGPYNQQLHAETAIRTQDPTFSRFREAGVTTAQVLPGSANLFGGQGVVIRTLDAVSVQEIKFPSAAPSLKMACGENPKYTYGEKDRFPTSRMGIVSGQRHVFRKAAQAMKSGEVAPHLKPIVDLLRGELRLHVHCYTSDDMAILLAMSQEFDFQITAFHHAAEAYKIADRLAAADVCAVVWADWWGFKMEIFDAVRANAAILEDAGACVALHSDSGITGQRLPIEASKAMAAGRRAGIDISPQEAIKWITSSPARMLGIDDQTGALEPGKRADLVIWSGDPFSIYTLSERVYIDGALVYDRAAGETYHTSDLELGQPALETVQ